MEARISRIDSASQPEPHFLPKLPRTKLEVVRGKARRPVREVHPPVFLIGAASDCDLVLGDRRFPEAYAYLYVTPRGVSIRHLGEGPDLLVNGEATESALLDDGDHLELGVYEFELHIEQRGRPADGDGGLSELREAWPEDYLGLDSALDDVWDLLAQVRQCVPMEPVDLRIFVGGPGPGPQLAEKESSHKTRPLAAFVSRRKSA